MKWLALFAFLLTSAPGFAADAGVSACHDVEQRLSATQRSLSSCVEQGRAASSARDRCEADLKERDGDVATLSQRVDACVAASEQRCTEAAAFAASLLQGTVRGGSCVPADTQRQLASLLDSWALVGRGLAQLAEYAAGTTEVLPRPSGGTEAERQLARLAGSRTAVPLWNRRILIGAFKLATPKAWAALRSQGSAAVEAFFESSGPMPKAFTTEAQSEHEEPPGPAGPPLSAALKLTLSYLELSGCEDRGAPGACSRARQLVELLDTTGPLIVRRRVEEMWATPCAGVNGETVRAWLQDFPVSKREQAQRAQAELSAAARSKLFLCYLADVEGPPSYAAWAASHLPPPTALDARTLPLVDAFTSFVTENGPLDRCGRAVRALQHVEPRACGVSPPASLKVIGDWALHPEAASPPPELEVCQRVAALLWSGASITIGDEFSRPPSLADMVRDEGNRHEAPMSKVRAACDGREGVGAAFESGLFGLTLVAKALGENTSNSPWRLDPAGGRPVELAKLEKAQPYPTWVQHTIAGESACEALGLTPERCAACREAAPGTRYDCELIGILQDDWRMHRRLSITAAAAVLALLLTLTWTIRVRRARRTFAAAARAAREQLEGISMGVSMSRWRWLFPSLHDTLELTLPQTPAWDRWGAKAFAVLAPSPNVVREADVNHAAQVALRNDVHVVFLLHDDTAVPDLGAVRATLDWAARGGTRAAQVLLLQRSRLAWATNDEDLLDLVESTTLRGNPFEVRGPVRSSSQFWNRERLVAGLLTESRAGNWVVVTGLRRFGKSSLALEVARRGMGPSAYVDLAGFHHEVSYGETPAAAVEAILQTLAMRLVESAQTRFPAASLPERPSVLDAPSLAAWLRALAVACGTSSGSPPPPLLLVMDETEQLLSATPERLGRALEVLATLAGRLRSVGAEPSSPHSSHTVSVMWCAALHPLLWAPLSTLGGQSVMGSFPSITVPALDDEAARAMMRGLGARQGIRFEEEALTLLVKASQGVPLLLRRLGTSVLELYDGDRARHGALGAMRIGVEGATEAIRREEREGSPLRVWVESEIAQADAAAGVLLRTLAQAEQVPVATLLEVAEAQVLERFLASGLSAHLPPAELRRRAQEAANVMLRVLASTGLLEAHGDLTAPDAYSLPEGTVRRILRAARRG